MDKKITRKRRATRTRMKIKELGVTRLCVNRTLKHLYVQVIVGEKNGDKVLACASTLDKEVKAAGGTLGNINAAKVIGNIIAKRAIAKGVKNVAFDRSGFRYHGCIKALADAAREGGLEF